MQPLSRQASVSSYPLYTGDARLPPNTIGHQVHPPPTVAPPDGAQKVRQKSRQEVRRTTSTASEPSRPAQKHKNQRHHKTQQMAPATKKQAHDGQPRPGYVAQRVASQSKPPVVEELMVPGPEHSKASSSQGNAEAASSEQVTVNLPNSKAQFSLPEAMQDEKQSTNANKTKYANKLKPDLANFPPLGSVGKASNDSSVAAQPEKSPPTMADPAAQSPPRSRDEVEGAKISTPDKAREDSPKPKVAESALIIAPKSSSIKVGAQAEEKPSKDEDPNTSGNVARALNAGSSSTNENATTGQRAESNPNTQALAKEDKTNQRNLTWAKITEENSAPKAGQGLLGPAKPRKHFTTEEIKQRQATWQRIPMPLKPGTKPPGKKTPWAVENQPPRKGHERETSIQPAPPQQTSERPTMKGISLERATAAHQRRLAAGSELVPTNRFGLLANPKDRGSEDNAEETNGSSNEPSKSDDGPPVEGVTAKPKTSKSKKKKKKAKSRRVPKEPDDDTIFLDAMASAAAATAAAEATSETTNEITDTKAAATDDKASLKQPAVAGSSQQTSRPE